MGAGRGGELQGYQTIAQRDDEVHPRLGMGRGGPGQWGEGAGGQNCECLSVSQLRPLSWVGT